MPSTSLAQCQQAIILEIDAYGIGLGAVLMQAGQPIAYFSKALGPQALAQSNYEKEAMVIL